MLGMVVVVVAGVRGALGTSQGQAGSNSFGVAKRLQLSCDVAAEWKVGG